RVPVGAHGPRQGNARGRGDLSGGPDRPAFPHHSGGEMKSHVKDTAQADRGRLHIEWADGNMPVLASIRESFKKSRPFEGLRIAACLHVTTETANLMRTLAAGGAKVALCASNPLTTQDDAAAALVAEYGISTF